MNICGVFGPTGSGKSRYLGRLIEAHRGQRTQIWVPEPFEAVRGVNVGSVAAFERRKGWPPVARFDDTADNVLALALRVGHRTVVVDEAHACWPKEYEPVITHRSGAVEQRPLAQLALRGRHAAVYLVWVAPSPLDVHVLLRSRATTLVMFGSTDPAVLAFVKSRCGEAVAERVARHTGDLPLIWDAAHKGLLFQSA